MIRSRWWRNPGMPVAVSLTLVVGAVFALLAILVSRRSPAPPCVTTGTVNRCPAVVTVTASPRVSVAVSVTVAPGPTRVESTLIIATPAPSRHPAPSPTRHAPPTRTPPPPTPTPSPSPTRGCPVPLPVCPIGREPTARAEHEARDRSAPVGTGMGRTVPPAVDSPPTLP